MNIFKPSTWAINRIRRDIDNYRSWIDTIKTESQKPGSLYNKGDISHNKFYTLYFTLDVDENELQLPDNIMKMRLIESLAPLHRYLDEELGFAECLTPEFNQIYDDEGKPSRTFLITYRFSFNYLSFWHVITLLIRWGVTIGGITYAAYKFGLIDLIKSLLQ